MFIHYFNRISWQIFFSVTIITLIIIVYKSEIYYNGLLRKHYFSPLIFFLFILFFFLLSKKFNYIVKFNVFLSIWLIGISLAFFEGFYIYSEIKNPTNREAEKNFAIENSKNQKHYIRYLPGGYLPEGPFDNIFPLSGIPNNITVMCEEDSGMITYLSDRYGFNNFDYVWDKKNKFFLIGDSFIEGSCVKKKFTLDNQLNELTGKNFISLGVGGNGPMLQLASMIEYALTEETREIYWFFYEGNDLTDLSIEKSSTILNRYLETNYKQNLKKKTKEIEIIQKVFLNQIMADKININDILFKIIKLGNIRNLLFGSYSKNDENLSKLIIDYEKILAKANELSVKNDIDFKFIFLPSVSSIGKYSLIHKEIKKIVKKNEIDFIDLKFHFEKFLEKKKYLLC